MRATRAQMEVVVAEPNVPGKPTKGTLAKVFLVLFLLALIFSWVTCASLGMPV